MEQSPNSIDIDQLVVDIRKRVREQPERASPPGLHRIENAEVRAPLISLATVQSGIARLESEATKIGKPTPGPQTLRGRVGAAAIRALSRMLWWYTYEIQSVLSSIVR